MRLWDTATGDLQETLRSYSGRVLSVGFSPDGRLPAAASDESTVLLWDTATAGMQQTLKGNSISSSSVSFSPDGRILASGSNDGPVLLWDTKTLSVQQTLEGNSGWTKPLVFSPDGCLLASGSHDNTIRPWDMVIRGHSHIISSLAFSPDGRLLASGASDKTVRLRNTPSDRLQETLSAEEVITELEFSQDGLYPITESGILDIQSAKGKRASGSIHKNPAISIEDDWIYVSGKNVLWLHPDFRPSCSAIHGNLIALGSGPGRVSMLRFRL